MGGTSRRCDWCLGVVATIMTGICARCGSDADPKDDYMPNAAEAYRFIKSNPAVTADFLMETWRVARDDDRCSNGRLREIWKQAGGAVDLKKDRAWIEVHLLPGLMRLLSEIPPSQSTPL